MKWLSSGKVDCWITLLRVSELNEIVTIEISLFHQNKSVIEKNIQCGPTNSVHPSSQLFVTSNGKIHEQVDFGTGSIFREFSLLRGVDE